MQSATPERFYPDEEIQANGDRDGNGHHSDEVSQPPPPTLPECHQRIAQLKGKLALMEETLCDYEIKLQVQEDARIASDFEKKKAREGYEQRIQHYERRISDMTLHIRTRDTQFLKAQEKNRILQRDLQTMQLKKHEMIQQAKREVREAMRREIDRERASLDTKQQPGNMTSGNHDHAFGNGATPSRAGVRGDIRRHPSSGAMFMKAFAGQAPVGSGDRGSELKQTDQLREACVESSLNDFFQLQL